MSRLNLEPGVYFTFGRRRFFFFRSAERGLAQVIADEPERGAMHVRVFLTPEEDDGRTGIDLVAIGHLPIGKPELLASLPEIVEKHRVPADALDSVATWRRRAPSGEVGVFSVSLFDAVGLVFATIGEANVPPTDLYVESAFPKRGGVMNTVSERLETGAMAHGGGPLPAGPGPVSVTLRGAVRNHGSVPYPFSDDQEPGDLYAVIDHD